MSDATHDRRIRWAQRTPLVLCALGIAVLVCAQRSGWLYSEAGVYFTGAGLAIIGVAAILGQPWLRRNARRTIALPILVAAIGALALFLAGVPLQVAERLYSGSFLGILVGSLVARALDRAFADEWKRAGAEAKRKKDDVAGRILERAHRSRRADSPDSSPPPSSPPST